MSTLVTLATLSMLASYACYVCYTLATLHLLRLLQFICYIYYPCYVCLLHFLPLLCWLRFQRFLKLLRLLHSTGGINRQPYIRNVLSHEESYLFIYLFYLSYFNSPFRIKNLLTKISISQSRHRFTEAYHICGPVFYNLTQEVIRPLSALQLSSTSLLWHLL